MPTSSAAHLLTRNSHRHKGAPPVAFLDDMTLERARVHEICGGARRRMVLEVAAAMTGTVMWIAPAWSPTRLNPDGFVHIIGPERLILLHPERAEDVLWSMEEALRAGIVPLVVADLPAPPGLTAIRRLHLAAETGAGEGDRTAPLGLILTPGTGGAPGVETRWSLAPDHGTGGAQSWKLHRMRARMQPEKQWTLTGKADRMARHP